MKKPILVTFFACGALSALVATKMLHQPGRNVSLETITLTQEKTEALPRLPVFTATSSNLTHDNLTYDNLTHDNTVDQNIPQPGLHLGTGERKLEPPTPRMALAS